MANQTFYGSVELRRSEGMGIGMFATAVIPRGTTIVSESALMIIPNEKNYMENVCNTYMNLSNQSRKEYDRLCADQKYIREYSEYEERIHFERWYDDFTRNSGVNFKTVAGQQKRANDVRNLIRAYAIYSTNGAGVEWGKKGKGGTGIFATYSRINHSCAPNCEWNYRGSNPVIMKVKTLRRIAVGEEIFICYNGEFLDPVRNLDRAARRQILRAWGFRCECTRCTNELRQTLASMPNSPFANASIVARSGLGKRHRSQIVDDDDDDEEEEEDDDETIADRVKALRVRRRRGGKAPRGSIM
ncbi:SET domain-containing protein [Hypoxylon sp. EC38]|nr:SET domain-containing protein [Hypoxylon sp. EC38]